MTSSIAQTGRTERPARTYATGPLTRMLRVGSVLVSLVITGWILLTYSQLPAIIPTHFGPGGEADEWGPRWNVLLLAGIMLLMTVGMAALSTKPRWMNYPGEVTEATAQAIYREGERLLVWAVLAMQPIYLGATLSVIGEAGGMLIALGLAGMALALVIGIVRLVRAGR